MNEKFLKKTIVVWVGAAGCVLLLAGCAGKEAGEPVNPLPFGAPIEGWQKIESEDVSIGKMRLREIARKMQSPKESVKKTARSLIFQQFW